MNPAPSESVTRPALAEPGGPAVAPDGQSLNGEAVAAESSSLGVPPVAAATTAAPDRVDKKPHAALSPGLIVAWVLAALGVAISALLWQKVAGMQEQLARQSAEAGTQSVEARTLARQAEETVRDTAAKVAVLESRLTDLSGYRAQLEDLAQSLARSRDENLAVDLEAALRVAQDQAHLTGSVEPLLAALATAQRRAGRSADPRMVPVVRAVARDLERVNAATVADTAGLLARIDQLLRQIDDLPAANEVGRGRPEAAPRENASAANSWWQRNWTVFLNEARSLLRVSQIERPEATLMSPEQVFFLRENLKMRLLSARLGVLARQYEAARADLAAASQSLNTYFDPASRRTQAAATLMQQVQGLTKSADLPRVAETLSALAALTATQARGTAK